MSELPAPASGVSLFLLSFFFKYCIIKVGRCAERDENTVSRSFSGEISGPEGPTCGIVSRKEGISAPSDLSGKSLPGRKPRIRSTVSVFSVSAEYGGAAASAEASLFQKRKKRLFLFPPDFPFAGSIGSGKMRSRKRAAAEERHLLCSPVRGQHF